MVLRTNALKILGVGQRYQTVISSAVTGPAAGTPSSDRHLYPPHNRASHYAEADRQVIRFLSRQLCQRGQLYIELKYVLTMSNFEIWGPRIAGMIRRKVSRLVNFPIKN